MFKDEVGIEREYFLLDSDGNIVEPALFGFPFDEFGFLVEIRTLPYTKTKPLIEELVGLISAHEAQAEKLGLKLRLCHRLSMDGEFVKHLRKKYAWDYLRDTTANIHNGVEVSHATGIDRWTNKIIWGTAGLHVHFSRKRILFPTQRVLEYPIIKRVQLPIDKIVLAMDARFSQPILLSNRIKGEYEIKPYGFEYRSLPADVNVLLGYNVSLQPVIDFAFSLLKKDREGEL